MQYRFSKMFPGTLGSHQGRTKDGHSNQQVSVLSGKRSSAGEINLEITLLGDF